MSQQSASPVGSDFIPLTEPERRELLRLARSSIDAALGLGAAPELELDSASLQQASGAFVSLYVDGRLHGCVGATARHDPLYATVIHVAGGAAFRDPRFPGLTPEETRRMRIEISRLSPLRPARAEEIDASRHGLCVEHGEARGLLLPQVARRYGWDRLRLLVETCLKAGLPATAWRDPEARLFVFEAEVFSDAEEPD
jgi:AmmeMemoRadiSam system protein A